MLTNDGVEIKAWMRLFWPCGENDIAQGVAVGRLRTDTKTGRVGVEPIGSAGGQVKIIEVGHDIQETYATGWRTPGAVYSSAAVAAQVLARTAEQKAHSIREKWTKE